MDKKNLINDKKIISFNPDGDFYYNKALDAMQKERFDEAHKYLKRATELSPNNPQILMQYGVLIMEEGRFPEAQEMFMIAHNLNSKSTEIIFYLAEVHAHLGLLRDSKAYAEQYISMDSEGIFAEECLEIIDFVEQKELFFKEEDSEDWEVYLLQEKARRHMELGEFKTAVEILESIVEDNPDFWAAYNNLALAYFYVGQTEEATELLHDVLTRNKGNLHALCNLAVFYYYDKKEEDLKALLELLMKIKPYVIEHRYKLGATFALVGKNKEAFDWLRSLQRIGFDGDAGFYFWLAQSAYFTGHEAIARKAYETLLEIDPSKKGYEPWADIDGEMHIDAVEQNREFLIEKIQNDYRSERMLGYYLLGKSAHKQEIIAHPSYINVEKLSALEKLFLASGLDCDLIPNTTFDKSFMRALETTDLLYEKYEPLDRQAAHLFQMWFTLCENALVRSYPFSNPSGLASAADYMFQSARYSNVTKKQISKKYGISVPTLTKYVNELIEFLPHLDLS